MKSPENSNNNSLLETAPPRVSEADAAALASAIYGCEGEVRRLDGERDSNFHIRPEGDDPGYMLKIANPAEPEAHTLMQTAVLEHLAARDPGLPVPRLCRTRDGRDHGLHRGADGTPQRVTLVTFLPGGLLVDHIPASPELCRSVGRMLGRLVTALRDFAHPAGERVLLWDLKQAAGLREYLPHITEEPLRKIATAVLDDFGERVSPLLADLPQQILHADFNPHNLVVDTDGQAVTGVFDFGDMVRTARVADLAVAASYHVGTDADPLAPVRDILAGYGEHVTLEDAECAILPDLVALRLVMSITISEWRAALYPENRDYILRSNRLARARLAAMATAGLLNIKG